MLALIMTSQTATAALMTMFRRLLNKFFFLTNKLLKTAVSHVMPLCLKSPLSMSSNRGSLSFTPSLSLLFSFPHLLPLFPGAHLHVVGMLQFISFDINLLNLPTLFLRVHFCLNSPSNYILLHKFSQLFSIFSLCSSGLICAASVLSTIHLRRTL